MKVIIDVQDGILFLLESVKPNMTVRRMKRLMKTSKGAEVLKQTFWFNETLLQDNRTLESYGIQDGAYLNLIYERDTGPISIVARFGIWEYPFVVNDTMTVAQFKEMFQEKTGIDMTTMKVCHRTEVLPNIACLHHYFVTEGSILRVQFKDPRDPSDEEEEEEE